MDVPFVDIHCHLLPGIDDGAQSWDESLAMAKLAEEDGTQVIITTPHQLGNYCANTADEIRRRTVELQRFLTRQGHRLLVLPGADVRVEDDLISRVQRGEIMTLADRGCHILLELPHELYFDLVPVVRQLERLDIQSILSHPERNTGLLGKPGIVSELVNRGCLMQVTAGSLTGAFGPASAKMAEWMLTQGLTHFLASDGHGVKSRRPKLGSAYQRAATLIGEDLAREICCANPADVSLGRLVPPGPRKVRGVASRSWFSRLRAG
jgi:protein-tyrosine phosphatase